MAQEVGTVEACRAFLSPDQVPGDPPETSKCGPNRKTLYDIATILSTSEGTWAHPGPRLQIDGGPQKIPRVRGQRKGRRPPALTVGGGPLSQQGTWWHPPRCGCLVIFCSAEQLTELHIPRSLAVNNIPEAAPFLGSPHGKLPKYH